MEYNNYLSKLMSYRLPTLLLPLPQQNVGKQASQKQQWADEYKYPDVDLFVADAD